MKCELLAESNLALLPDFIDDVNTKYDETVLKAFLNEKNAYGIAEHFYKCTNEILSDLGKMYAGGGEFTENINKMGGEGTAEFTHRAIQIYCG